MITLRHVGYSLSVIVVASILTTLGIKASDTMTASDALCPVDMMPVEAVPGVTCVDAFEAVPGSSCPHHVVANPQSTKGNIAIATCIPEGDRNIAEPWRFVTREDARVLCARVGKRLPTAKEWYEISLSVPVETCVFSAEQPHTSGVVSDCVSVSTVHNLPGNVWEWVNDDVIEGMYNGRKLPETGYVAAVDDCGVVSLSSSTPVADFGMDYAWTTASGIMGMVRGGFYRSGEDGGLYAVQTNVPPTFASAGIGFRCVR
jgi:hypothetical protein